MSARLFVPIDPHVERVVSSAEVERVGAHDHVRIWNRGGLAGELVVVAGDGERVAKLLGLEDMNERAKEDLAKRGIKPVTDEQKASFAARVAARLARKSN